MGGFAAAIGGLGQGATEYGQQMRSILESHRHDFANLIAQTLPTVQDPEFKSYLFGLGGDLAANKPLGPLMENFRNKYQKYQQTEQQYHDQTSSGTPTASPAPPAGAGSGQVNGVKPPLVAMPESLASRMASVMSGSVQAPSQPNMFPGAMPESNPIKPGSQSWAMASIMGTPDVTAPIPATPSPAVQQSAAPSAQSASALSDQYQLTPLEQANMAQYQKELSAPFGVSPRTAAAVAPIFQRQAQLSQLRATAQVEVEKTKALRDQQLALAQSLGIDIAKLPTSARVMLATEGKLPPPQLLKPGEAYVDSDGKVIASGAPLVQFAPEGSTPAITQPVSPGVQTTSSVLPNLSGSAMEPVPGVTFQPPIPPKLSPEETRAVSAALQTAKAHNVPFDPNLNPRNPLAQLPPQYQTEASSLAKVMNEDPEIRAQRLETAKILEQMHQMQMLLVQTQLGTVPTASDYSLMAKSIVDHTLSPDELRLLRSGGMRGWDPAKVFTDSKTIDPTFSWEKAENEYKAMTATERNFTSGPAANVVRANNVALEHLGMLDEAREALNNGNIPVLNAIANAVGVQAGKSAKTTYDTIAQRVGQEVNSSYISGGGGQVERLASSSNFNSSSGDNQIKNNIKATVKLMESQQRGLEDQYKRGTYGQGSQELWTPGALAARDRIVGPMRAVAGAPVTFIVPGNPKPYNIPPDKVTEFMKDNPTAKRQ